MAFYLSFWRSLYLENREWCANIGQHCCLVIPGWSCFGQPCSTLHSDTALISMLEWEDPGHHQKGQEMVLSGGGFTMLLVDLRPELVQSWFVPNGTENYLDLRPQIADPDRQLDMDHTKTLSHAKSRVGKQAKRNVSTFGWFSWLKLPFGGYPYCPTPPKRHTQLSNTILSEVTLRAVDAIPEGVRPKWTLKGKMINDDKNQRSTGQTWNQYDVSTWMIFSNIQFQQDKNMYVETDWNTLLQCPLGINVVTFYASVPAWVWMTRRTPDHAVRANQDRIDLHPQSHL